MIYRNFFVEKKEAQFRFNICKMCDEIRKPLFQCNQCGCLLKFKVKIKDTECPLKKW